MNKLNVPNSFEECKTVEEAVAFYVTNGYCQYEAYEIVERALHDPMSNDISISSPVTSETRFDWFSL